MNDARPTSVAGSLPAAAVATLATALFLAPWWNRFLGLTLDGYTPWYGHLILAGQIPYRDFFLHLPPLSALLDAAIEHQFGCSLLAMRAVGAIGRLAIAAVLALWLARRFRPATAVLATLASVWLASGDDTDILDLYNPHAQLLAIASGYFACIALDGGRYRRPAWIAAGIASGLGFWTKQTIGLGCTVAVPIGLGLLMLGDRAARGTLVRGLALFAAGWGIPALAIGGWLAKHGALAAFAQQVFLDAAGSKGSPLELLFRPWLDPLKLREFVGPAQLGGSLAMLGLLCIRPGQRPGGSSHGRWRGLALAAVVAGAALAVGWHLADRDQVSYRGLRDKQRVGVFASTYGLLIPAGLLAFAAGRRPLDASERERLILVLVAGASGAMLAISWPAAEGVALPGLAVVVAMAADDPIRARLVNPLRALTIRGLPIGSAAATAVTTTIRALPISAAAVAMVAVITLKLLAPYRFAAWAEPGISKATERSHQPALRGLWMSKMTRFAVDRTARVIRLASSPDEPIFVFPNLPLFHWLTGRPAATFAVMHWMDVTPDRIVAEDLERLLSAPPVVIVRQHMVNTVLANQENYFRAGRVSALRALSGKLAELLDERYVKISGASAAAGWGFQPIEVWVRRDRALERGLPAALDPGGGAPPRTGKVELAPNLGVSPARR